MTTAKNKYFADVNSGFSSQASNIPIQTIAEAARMGPGSYGEGADSIRVYRVADVDRMNCVAWFRRSHEADGRKWYKAVF